jgi:ADP-ribose pyrophosphatase
LHDISHLIPDARQNLKSPIIQTDPFTIVDRHIAYQNPWITVEHQDVLRPDGSPGVYGIVRFANHAVGVLPIAANGDVWLVGQYRRPVESYSWEIPEGGAPHGEDPLEAAKRELFEETGLLARTWLKVLEIDLSNSVSDEAGTCFIATDLQEGVATPDVTEVLSIKTVPFTVLMDMIDRGEIRDSLTVATALRAHHLASTGRLPDGLRAAILKT